MGTHPLQGIPQPSDVVVPTHQCSLAHRLRPTPGDDPGPDGTGRYHHQVTTDGEAASVGEAMEPTDGIIADIADELRWTFAERKGWLLGFGFNLVVAAVYVGYQHYDPHVRDDVRVAGIATAVAVWVLADVINTNLLGSDADRVRHSIDRNDRVARILALKGLALGVLLLPLTVAISVGTRLAIDRWRSIPHAVMLDVWVVFAWLGVGALLSVVLPYNPISLKQRWKDRRTWPRWILCLLVPYAALGVVRYLAWPADRIARHLLGRPDHHLLGYAFIYMCWGVAVWLLCLGLAEGYAAVGRSRFERDLQRTG